MNIPTEKSLRPGRRLILALADSDEAEILRRGLHRRGWDVHLARTGPEARQLAYRLQPRLVVLGTDLQEESGWLTCAKLAWTDSEQRVVLFQRGASHKQQRLAQLVGATVIVGDNAELWQLVDELDERALYAAATR